MASSKLSETLIGREVERLFGQISVQRGELCWNPVTGAEFVYGLDPIKPQKEAARRRLLIREYFALNSPADAPLMPTDEGDRRYAKYAGARFHNSAFHLVDRKAGRFESASILRRLCLGHVVAT
jgi:hypothetical protein